MYNTIAGISITAATVRSLSAVEGFPTSRFTLSLPLTSLLLAARPTRSFPDAPQSSASIQQLLPQHDASTLEHLQALLRSSWAAPGQRTRRLKMAAAPSDSSSLSPCLCPALPAYFSGLFPVAPWYNPCSRAAVSLCDPPAQTPPPFLRLQQEIKTPPSRTTFAVLWGSLCSDRAWKL